MDLRRVGYAILIGGVVCLLLPFVFIALYSSPFTDDFCLSSHSFRGTLAEISQYYFSVGGRLPALFLITLPSDLAHLTGLNIYVVYPAVMFLSLLTFIAAIIAASILVLGRAESGLLFGLLFSVFAISLVPSLKEFAYWMPGTACYLTASIGACLYLAWLANVTINDEPIKPKSIAIAIAGCFVTAEFNEFTVFFLLGITCLAAAVRMLSPKPRQLGAHLAIIAATCAGYCIVLFTPGNSHRMALFQNSGNIGFSISNASTYSLEYAVYLVQLPVVQAFGALAVCFALTSRRRGHARLPAFAFATGLFILGAIWVYTGYFIGAFGTGELIPLRARNELLVVFLFSCSAALILLVQSAIGSYLPYFNRVAFWAALAGTLFILPVRYTRNFEDLRAEWPKLATFWEESIARDLLLSDSQSDEIIVPRRSAFPPLLMGEELTEQPDRLPNDCIARYYGKSSVVLAPSPSQSGSEKLGARPLIDGKHDSAQPLVR